jgi:uncharacterized membrane protein YdjX (TVP38/TMEM64 family)
LGRLTQAFTVPSIGTRRHFLANLASSKDDFSPFMDRPPKRLANSPLKDEVMNTILHSVPKKESNPQLEHHNKGHSDTATFAALAVAVAVASAAAAFGTINADIPSAGNALVAAEHFFADPTAALEGVVHHVESMGPTGILYFGVVYTILEVLAVPAFPLTASAGYLFGLTTGTAVVLTSASIAAAISFLIGRTLLRTYVEELLQDFPEFQKMDKAIGKEGFKLMLLLRLSPIFPFALSNYLYGASSVQFWPYFWGTMVGFTPGTLVYVFSGQVGKAITIGGGGGDAQQPWYVYAGALVAVTGLFKVIADVATGVIRELEEESA